MTKAGRFDSGGFLPDGIRPGLFFFGDNLEGLQKLAAETIDLIYLDPPFNSKKQWSGMVEDNREQTEVAFKDTWTMGDIKPEWLNRIGAKEQYDALREVAEAVRATAGDAAMAYILYMAIRLTEMHRVLKPTGSIYYHCDPVMSHGVKLLMDSIFGADNFRNEIVWCYGGGGVSKRDFARKHDTIFRYAKSGEWVYNIAYKEYKANTQAVGKHSTLSGGGKIDLERGTPITDWWTDIKTTTGWSPERTGYPTQKPEALLERIILASTNEGDIVLDPFAGSGTACAVAEKLGRRRIGMDLNETAAITATLRLQKVMDERRETKAAPLLMEGSEDIGMILEQGAAESINNAAALPDAEGERQVERGDHWRARLCAMALQKQHGRCLGCGRWAASGDAFECDHIEPRSRGGLLTEDNTQALCRKCNGKKASGTMANLWERLEEESNEWPADFWLMAANLTKAKRYNITDQTAAARRHKAEKKKAIK